MVCHDKSSNGYGGHLYPPAPLVQAGATGRFNGLQQTDELGIHV